MEDLSKGRQRTKDEDNRNPFCGDLRQQVFGTERRIGFGKKDDYDKENKKLVFMIELNNLLLKRGAVVCFFVLQRAVITQGGRFLHADAL